MGIYNFMICVTLYYTWRRKHEVYTHEVTLFELADVPLGLTDEVKADRLKGTPIVKWWQVWERMFKYFFERTPNIKNETQFKRFTRAKLTRQKKTGILMRVLIWTTMATGITTSSAEVIIAFPTEEPPVVRSDYPGRRLAVCVTPTDCDVSRAIGTIQVACSASYMITADDTRTSQR